MSVVEMLFISKVYIWSISKIFVSFSSQEYLEHEMCIIYYVFHKNLLNNLECLEHFRIFSK